MELTRTVLAPFIGGQVEEQSHNGTYRYRGTINDLRTHSINGHVDPYVELEWAASFKDGQWVFLPRQDSFEFCMEKYEALIAENGRLVLVSDEIGETVTFFMPGDEELDPAEVDGLTVS